MRPVNKTLGSLLPSAEALLQKNYRHLRSQRAPELAVSETTRLHSHRMLRRLVGVSARQHQHRTNVERYFQRLRNTFFIERTDPARCNAQSFGRKLYVAGGNGDVLDCIKLSTLSIRYSRARNIGAANEHDRGHRDKELACTPPQRVRVSC